MIKHYLILAWRNLRKYRLQNVVSIVGLAAGFVCLSLSAIWVHYYNTFNGGIPDGDRVYKVAAGARGEVDNMTIEDSYYQQLLELPELEVVTSLSLMGIPDEHISESGYDNQPKMDDCRIIDSLFTDIFPLEVVSGSLDFLWREEDMCIITESFAREHFPGENPVGQHCKAGNVAAVIKDLDPHFSLCAPLFRYLPQHFHSSVFVKLRKGADVALVEQKLNDLRKDEENKIDFSLLPMAKAHQYIWRFSSEGNLSQNHVKTFRWASVGLVLCAFAGYLVLYLNRTRSRRREMALRTVHGAQPMQNVWLFATESLFVFAAAIGLGLLGVYALAKPFAAYAEVTMKDGLLLGQSLLYMVACMAVCVVLCLISTAIVCRRSLQQSLQSSRGVSRLFQRLSIGIQLVISLALSFCVSVMLLQFHHQRTTDWGHNAYGVMYFDDPYSPTFDCAYWQSRLAALPMVEDVTIEYEGGMNNQGWYVNFSDDPANDSTYFRYFMPADPANPHWQLKVLEGSLPTAEMWQPNEVAITASAAKELGLEHPVGQLLYRNGRQNTTVVAVLGDIANANYNAPAVVQPTHIAFPDETPDKRGKLAVFFPPSQRKALSEAVRALVKEEEQAQDKVINFMMDYSADGYEDALRKDRNMARLLGIVTGVALLVALFGIYSIITLACRQRRREIAVRKVYGAKVGDVLSLFIKEYGLILVLSSAVAFVVGTLIMHRWLEHYVMRVPLYWWLYVGLFVAVALLIALCVGARVWKTAQENPADVVKSE